MGLSDILNAGKIKRENEELKQMLTPEMQNVMNLNHQVENHQKTLDDLEKQIADKKKEFSDISNELDRIKNEIITFSDEVLVQEFGLYQPRYDFITSDQYKQKIANIRCKQKEMIKNRTAALGNMNWTVNNSASKGKKMVKDMQKLLLRAFNSECDEIIGKVKYNNFESSRKKIIKSSEQIQKLGSMMQISISPRYIELKIDELHLALEFQMKKQEEKEQLRELRAQQREETRLKKEIAEQRKKIAKEQSHYMQALDRLLKQIEQNGESPEFISRRNELENELKEIEKSIKDIDYREANQRAGYVYVISNIGSFGENIYKIGMTRRLNPQDRVDELGDASVPFNFDVHAMIFSEDAPALENSLHKAFEDKKLNMVNARREFFNVSLDDIKKVVKENYDKTVEFVEFPDAEQYRMSLKMKQDR